MQKCFKSCCSLCVFVFVRACVFFRYQGYIGAALVLGGMDCNGPHLYSIYPHGSTDKLPYVTMGQCYSTAAFLDCCLHHIKVEVQTLTP